jgi:hypothetical protein
MRYLRGESNRGGTHDEADMGCVSSGERWVPIKLDETRFPSRQSLARPHQEGTKRDADLHTRRRPECLWLVEKRNAHATDLAVALTFLSASWLVSTPIVSLTAHSKTAISPPIADHDRNRAELSAVCQKLIHTIHQRVGHNASACGRREELRHCEIPILPAKKKNNRTSNK